jgi:hypothetical protein
MNPQEIKMMNETVINGFTSDNSGIRKQAEDKVNNYLRLRQREEGFARKFYDVADVTPADLDKQVDTPLPVIVKDMEPNSAGAYTVPFGTSPLDSNLTAPRYRVMFDRIMSRRYVSDVNELLTYDMDIRQIFNDFILKDILAEEDRKFMSVVDTITKVDSGGLNTVNPTLAACQYIEAGSIDRPNLANAMRGLPTTNRRLNPVAALINNITIWDVVALDRTAIGGDLAEDMFVNGFTERQIMGLKWNITIKNDLVADNDMYMMAAPKYLGDFFVLDNICMSTKHEDFMLSFYAYECVGATVANIAAVAAVTFTGTPTNWRTGAPL